MNSLPESMQPYAEVLDKLHSNATYSAQTYYESTKRAEFWGKAIVFAPAIVSALAGMFVALGADKSWGVASAMAGLVAATGSFLGAERKANSYKESARRYTQLRHEIEYTRSTIPTYSSVSDLALEVRKIKEQYQAIIDRDEPTPNRSFAKANKRIQAGVTDTAQPRK
jgi:hypothetical protein